VKWFSDLGGDRKAGSVGGYTGPTAFIERWRDTIRMPLQGIGESPGRPSAGVAAIRRRPGRPPRRRDAGGYVGGPVRAGLAELVPFILQPAVIECILAHLGLRTRPPPVLPARAPPELQLGV